MIKMDGIVLIIIIIITVILSVLLRNASTETVLQEVSLGEMAILECPSNDDQHRFQFWLLNTKDVVGPGSDIDKTKYKYEVLTGTLFIKDVSQKEHGLYTCFCRHLSGMTYNAKSVELVVRRNWDDLYEHDYSTNKFRIVMLFLVAVILVLLLSAIYFLRQDKPSFFRDLSDEESADETNKPSTSYANMSSSTKDLMGSTSHGVDNPTLDTEFPKEFQTSVVISSN